MGQCDLSTCRDSVACFVTWLKHELSAFGPLGFFSLLSLLHFCSAVNCQNKNQSANIKSGHPNVLVLIF